MEIRGATVTLRQPEITSFSRKRETCSLLPTDENCNDDVQILTYLGDFFFFFFYICCSVHHQYILLNNQRPAALSSRIYYSMRE
jgi:hypothetical protein